VAPPLGGEYVESLREGGDQIDIAGGEEAGAFGGW
jgi:hypothetical protein